MNWLNNLLTGVTRIAAWLLALSFCLQANATLTPNDGRKNPHGSQPTVPAEKRVQTDDDATEATTVASVDLVGALIGPGQPLSLEAVEKIRKHKEMLNSIPIGSIMGKRSDLTSAPQNPGSRIPGKTNVAGINNNAKELKLDQLLEALRTNSPKDQPARVRFTTLEQSSEGAR